MEKLEKQVSEAEAERLISKWFTKKTVLTLMLGIALLYIWIRVRFSHGALPPSPAAQAYIQPAPIPKAQSVSVPKQPTVDDPRVGVPYPNPAPYQQPGPNGYAPTQPAEDPMKQLRAAHLQRETESAFASMMVPEETKQAAPSPSKEPPARSMDSTGNPAATETAVATPLYVIPQGTVAPLALDSRVQSEMSGPVDAHFTEDVYLPGTRTLIIPQGSKALGEVAQVGNVQQRRLALRFTKIQRDPVNRSCDISLTEPALDEAGSAGVTGKVDAHLASTILGSVLVGVLQGASVSILYGNGGGYGPGQVMLGNLANGGTQTAGKLLDRWTNQLPRITVYEGGRLTMPFTKDTKVSLCDETN